MIKQVYNTLPDDRPITSICVIEDVEKCPSGYVTVNRTHDQDSDADLWRETNFFGKKYTRYVCLSKTEGTPDYIVDSVTIINEKEVPPEGYTSLSKTFDSAQKAWRKKQLCYRFCHKYSTSRAVTDIIILSRTKKAPDGFKLLGEINGLTICYKMGNSSCVNNFYPPSQTLTTSLAYSLSPGQQLNSPTADPPSYQNIHVPSKSHNSNGDTVRHSPPHDYERLAILTPKRPAPKPPVSSAYATISGYNGLEGVPFVLNPKIVSSGNGHQEHVISEFKSDLEIDADYSYDFRTEKATT